MKRCKTILFIFILTLVSMAPFYRIHRRIPGTRSSPSPFAYLMVVGNGSIVDGCVAALASLRMHSPCVQRRRCQVLCLVAPKGLNPLAMQQLRTVCEVMDGMDAMPSSLRSVLGSVPPHQYDNVTALAVWSLVQYQRVVLLSEDVVVVQSPDALLHVNLSSGTYSDVAGISVLCPSLSALNAAVSTYAERRNGKPSSSLLSAAAETFSAMGSGLDTRLYNVPTTLGQAEPHGGVVTIRYVQPPWVPALSAATAEFGEAYWFWWGIYEQHHLAHSDELQVPMTVAVHAQEGQYAHKGPPSARTHGWLRRGTRHQFLQRLHTLEWQDRHLWLPNLMPLTSRESESCEMFCYKRSNVCSERGLQFTSINSCDAMRAMYNCSSCVAHRNRNWAPGFNATDKVCYINVMYNASALPNCTIWAKHVARLCPCVPLDKYYEPTVAFHNVSHTRHMDAEVQATDADYRKAREAHPSGCYPTITDFTDEVDEKCGAYLSNVSNIRTIKVMAAPFLFARTVKFHVHYHEPGIRAVLKVSQDGFLFEPHSEWMAWRVDRLMNIRRVPPTHWIDIPMRMLEDAIAAGNDTALTDWTNTAFVHHSQKTKRVHRDPDTGQDMLGCSVQLWMADVHQLDLSIFAMPYKRWVEWYTPGKKPPKNANQTSAMPSLAEQVIYDYILGNDDRRTNKNCYVAGGCRYQCRRPDGDDQSHLGPPTLLYIDQGKAFYMRDDPPNPLSDPNNTYCKLPRHMYRTCVRFSANNTDGKVSSKAPKALRTTLFHRLRDSTPEHIYRLVGDSQVKYCQRRLEAFLKHVHWCIDKYGEDRVLLWP